MIATADRSSSAGQGLATPGAIVGLIILLELGLMLRLQLWLADRSLWIDEARLALNIATRSYLDLLKPLDHDQTAPVVFLWLERLATQVVGVSDWTLRIFPLVGGVGTVMLVYPLARRAGLSAAASAIGTGLAALSPSLIYYSTSVKPYAFDGLVSALLVLLTFHVLDAPDSRSSRLRLLGAGVLAPWLSASAVFVLAGAALALVRERRRHSPTASRWLATAVAAWTASFALTYQCVYRVASRNPYMLQFWNEAFLDPGPGWARRVVLRLREVVWGTFLGGSTKPVPGSGEDLVFTIIAAGLLVVAGIGLTAMARRRLAHALLLATPFAAAIGASILGAYPIALRLMLFAAPLLTTLVAAGLDSSTSSLPSLLRNLALPSLSFVLLGIQLVAAVSVVSQSALSESVRPLVEEFVRRAPREDPVYVAAGSLPAWTFYTTDWSRPDTARLAHIARMAGRDGPAFENAAPRGTVLTTGDSALVLRYDGRLELLGRSLGIQRRPGLPPVNLRPDNGWSEEEAGRILASGTGAVWLLLSHLHGFESDLLDRLHAAGARQTYRNSTLDVLLVRYQLPDPPPR